VTESAGPVASPEPFRLGPDAVTPSLFNALQTGVVIARADATVITLSGGGAVAALQGLLTNDVEKPGDGAFLYAALLTPKGLMIADGWLGRRSATVTFTVPAEAGPRVRAVFTRSIPPKMARLADPAPDLAVLRLVGPQAVPAAQAAGFAPPAAGHVTGARDNPRWEIARAPDPAAFTLQIIAPVSDAAAITQRIVTAGAYDGGPAALECARILSGWPRLGAEVDDKTIPQEVLLDELGGVSYTKGCYTGQETVSRLHFRGHVNRLLRGLLFDGEPAAGAAPVLYLDKDAGRVTSVAWIPEGRVAGGGRWIGTAMVRREVEPGMVVRAAGRDARVVSLPFTLPFTAPA